MADRITVSGDAVVQEDDSTGDITIHVDQGTVSQAATEPDEIPRFDQLGGGGMWEEDANSPQTASGVPSLTYTMDTTYDRVLIEYTVFEGMDINMQFNGDDGSNYRYHTSDGTSTTGASSVERISTVSTNQRSNGSVLVGQFESGIKATPLDRDGSSSVPIGSDNTNVSHPLTQFTFIFTSSIVGDATVRVFGRDI